MQLKWARWTICPRASALALPSRPSGCTLLRIFKTIIISNSAMSLSLRWWKASNNMSNIFSNAISEQLDKHNISLDSWRELIQRLLDYGVLCRDDSQVEAEIYDRFVRIAELVNDYLALMGVRFQHDTTFHFVRILPPGARLAGMEDESDEPF